jgi:acetyltransferase-like isoleucine patch superfamily enzyme
VKHGRFTGVMEDRMRTLYLCGATNPEGVRLARRINRDLERWDRLVLLDDDPATHGGSILGVTVAGGFELLRRADPDLCQVVNLVARTARKRRSAWLRIAGHRLPPASLIHSDVDTGGVFLENEVTVYGNATLSAMSHVGAGTVVFMGAVVGHGSSVGAGCLLSPNAVLEARVMLEEGVSVGINASILPDVRIGAWATIAPGALVVEDVPAGAVASGNPARVLRDATAKRQASWPAAIR